MLSAFPYLLPPLPARVLHPSRDARALGSYLKNEKKEYRVRVKLKVEELDEGANPDENSGDEWEGVGDENKQLVALSVLDALCECAAGGRGGCHHTAVVLYLCRLLRLTDAELAAFNPSSVTGQACAWVQQNCKGGRSVEECPFYGMSLSQISAAVRALRNPGGQLGVADDAPMSAKGVPPIDRMTEYNPHPTGGKWADQKIHFDKGVDISSRKWEKLKAFVDGERSTSNQRVGIDVLPPRVRDEG